MFNLIKSLFFNKEEAIRTKEIVFFGKKVTLQCDGNCNKAWGKHTRPNKSDAEIGDAPIDPKTYEGWDAKPLKGEDMNKWCARECERSKIIEN